MSLFFLSLSSLEIVKNSEFGKAFRRPFKLRLKFSGIERFLDLNRIILIYQVRK